jgi:hypothetical protein
VTKSDLKDNQKLMVELRQRVETLKTENETQLKLKDLNYSEKLKEMTDKYMNEIEGLKQLTTALNNDREGNEQRHMNELDTARQTNKNELKEIDASFTMKMAAESEKYSELSTRMDQLKSAWEKQMADTESFHLARVAQITDYYKKKIEEKQNEILQVS